MTDDSPPRTVVGLGGNAISPAGTAGTAAEQQASIARAMRFVAELIVTGHELVITHGNGPQVGSLLIKNEMARDVVPPMPLDWCVAQTQATIGFTIITELERELAARGNLRTVVPVISRVEVSPDDPAWKEPSKPIGPYLRDEALIRARMAEGQTWVRQGPRGWRRVVPSPEPTALLDPMTIRLLLDAGAVVVANGGGGIPMVREGDRLRGVEAVVDKDLSGALLAETISAEAFAILTDVPGVAVAYGTPDERWLEEATTASLRALQAEGHFAAGSMGPKVEAVVRFVESTGHRAVIASLDDVAAAVAGQSGTRVLPC